jgi:hypothetical protein
MVVYDFESYSGSSEFSPHLDVCVWVFLLTDTFISAKYVILGESEEYQPPCHLELMFSVPSANHHSRDHIATGGNVIHPGVPMLGHGFCTHA